MQHDNVQCTTVLSCTVQANIHWVDACAYYISVENILSTLATALSHEASVNLIRWLFLESRWFTMWHYERCFIKFFSIYILFNLYISNISIQQTVTHCPCCPFAPLLVNIFVTTDLSVLQMKISLKTAHTLKVNKIL